MAEEDQMILLGTFSLHGNTKPTSKIYAELVHEHARFIIVHMDEQSDPIMLAAHKL